MTISSYEVAHETVSSFTPDDLLDAARGILTAESDLIACLANLSALLFEALDRVNWVGFYLLKQTQNRTQGRNQARQFELVLGPFQGRVACTRIPLGRGVCGTAAQSGQTQRVADVHEFDGHIACDSASESEIVLPIRGPDGVVGVLDIDSPVKNRFSAGDQTRLEELVGLLEDHLEDHLRNASS